MLLNPQREDMGFFPVIIRICFVRFLVGFAHGLGANWGIQSTHPLNPSIVVNLLKENRFQKVKLFNADAETMNALGKSGLQVMVGIPNDVLAKLATSVKAAEDWVLKNVSSYVQRWCRHQVGCSLSLSSAELVCFIYYHHSLS
ncbi:hypothetical protein AMTRI_Chr02g265550 [Amborella trichopoda]